MSGIDPFHGSKAAVFIGRRLLVYLRDDRPDIPWPGHWDFPGGGREGAETPEETLLREMEEEFALRPGLDTIRWRRPFTSPHIPGARVWFFVLSLPEAAERQIVFGDEGQFWALKTWEEFARLPNIVPTFPERMRVWEEETGGLSTMPQ